MLRNMYCPVQSWTCLTVGLIMTTGSVDKILVCRLKWNILHTDCGSLVPPLHGDVDTSSGTQFGDLASYTCDTGYRLVGTNVRNCTATGDWSLSQAACIIYGMRFYILLNTQSCFRVNCINTTNVL